MWAEALALHRPDERTTLTRTDRRRAEPAEGREVALRHHATKDPEITLRHPYGPGRSSLDDFASNIAVGGRALYVVPPCECVSGLQLRAVASRTPAFVSCAGRYAALSGVGTRRTSHAYIGSYKGDHLVLPMHPVSSGPAQSIVPLSPVQGDVLRCQLTGAPPQRLCLGAARDKATLSAGFGTATMQSAQDLWWKARWEPE